MSRQKLLMRLFAAIAVVMIAALVCTALVINAPQTTHAAGGKGKSTPRFVRFHHNFSDATLATTSLKHWSSAFVTKGTKYRYTMVGTNPARGSATSTIPVTIVPLVLKFSNGASFDGTQKVPGTTQSPIFQSAPFISGTTQYGDAIQRAEFWNSVSTTSSNYHVLLGTPTVAPAITIQVPAANGATAQDASGKTIGIIDINWFDPQIQNLLVSQHFTSNMLPIFLSNDVYLSSGAPSLSNCCIGGYHNATSTQKTAQTYIWSTNADAGIQGGFGEDVSALSHELAEWLNDPFTNNMVPNWISPIAPQYGCNNFLEVGDPLVGVVFTVSGFSGSHLQDEAFYSWFARQTSSKGINRQYTYLGTFAHLSQTC